MPTKERVLDRMDVMTGYAARAKGTNKWLRNKWQGGAQTGTNVQTLTNDRTKMSIDEKKMVEIYCEWYNHNHKEKVEFEILEVEMLTKTTVDILIK